MSFFPSLHQAQMDLQWIQQQEREAQSAHHAHFTRTVGDATSRMKKAQTQIEEQKVKLAQIREKKARLLELSQMRREEQSQRIWEEQQKQARELAALEEQRRKLGAEKEEIGRIQKETIERLRSLLTPDDRTLEDSDLKDSSEKDPQLTDRLAHHERQTKILARLED